MCIVVITNYFNYILLIYCRETDQQESYLVAFNYHEIINEKILAQILQWPVEIDNLCR